MDWISAGLPREGDLAGEPSAGDLARKDPPTCGLKESAQEIKKRMEKEERPLCVVVDEDKIVLGVLHTFQTDAETTAEQEMNPAPPTIRASMRPHQALRMLEDAESDYLLVTNGEGQLLGALYKTDLERG